MGTVIVFISGLEAVEFTVRTEGSLMEPIAVTVELGLGEVGIVRKMIFRTELVGDFPGCSFDFETFDVELVIVESG